jgi:hypothetical protein
VDISTPTANAVALYNLLPQGAFTADQLLEFGTLRTALAVLAKDDAYNMTFREDEAGRVCMSGSRGGNTGCIVHSYFGCDGVIHTVDNVNFLTPNQALVDVPQTLATMYDIPAADLQLGPPAPVCSATLAQALQADEAVSWTAAAVQGGAGAALLGALGSSSTAVTMFVVEDAVYRERFNAAAGEIDASMCALGCCPGG